MRALLWLIGLFALAAVASLLATHNSGYVLIVSSPYRIQLSLNLVICLLVLGFLAAYLLVRLVRRTLRLPGAVGRFRAHRRHEGAQRKLRDSLAVRTDQWSRELDNVRMALQRPLGTSLHFWKSVRSLDVLDDRIDELLDAVGLASYRDLPAAGLPYGRKRALEFATTLALEPELMLLDEPTSGLGHEDVDRIADLIRQVSANRTILMVEHNLSVVAKLADKITVLARGKVLAEGPYSEISENPEVIEAYIGGADG